MNYLLYISWISDISILIPIVIYFRRENDSETSIKILIIYILSILIRNIIGVSINIAYFFDYKLYNLFYYNWQSIIGFYLLSFVYYSLLKSVFWKRIVIFFWIVFFLFALLDANNGTLVNINTGSFNKYSYSVAAIFILTTVSAYLYQVLKDLVIDNILEFPFFWLSAGCMVYFGGTLLMYIYLLSANDQQGMLSWIFEIILSIIFNILLTLTIWYSSKPRTSSK